MSMKRPGRTAIIALIVVSQMLAGCMGGDEKSAEPMRGPIFDSFVLIDAAPHDDPRNFSTIDLGINQSAEFDWAVFGNEEGGNCCEHYLATTKEGLILNFGGEYPTWSEDRGHTWDEYLP
ncbi:MAG: hypothetical protein NZ802_02695, partial [Candidatus Poseidoniales archaeon]|nr:hypothetical protein [Candidatus Poseidoniales archaeon]